jgi:hypothetical protein
MLPLFFSIHFYHFSSFFFNLKVPEKRVINYLIV